MGITGASGAAYARRLVQCFVAADVHVHLTISALGLRVLSDELDIRHFSVEALLGDASERVTLYPHRDLGARIASGSFLTDGMVVCPCSANTLAAIANGLAGNLVTRAAQVTLKEQRRLVLVPRETPLSPIDLENMLRASRGGAVLCPANPGFYMRPQSVSDLVDFVVGRVLDLFQVPHQLNTRWQPTDAEAAE